MATQFELSGTVSTEAALTDANDNEWIILEEIPELENTAPVVSFQVTNGDGSDALTAFKLNVKSHAGAAAYTLLTGMDWDTADGVNLKIASANPSTLAAEGTADCMVYLGAAYAFQFAAAGDASPVTVKGRILKAGR